MPNSNTNYIYVNLGIVFFWLISELKEFSEGEKKTPSDSAYDIYIKNCFGDIIVMRKRVWE